MRICMHFRNEKNIYVLSLIKCVHIYTLIIITFLKQNNNNKISNFTKF